MDDFWMVSIGLNICSFKVVLLQPTVQKIDEASMSAIVE